MNRLTQTQQARLEPNQLLSVPQVGQENGVHENTVRGWIRSGQLPAVKIGPRMIRVRRSDLEDFLTPYEAEASVWARPVK